MITMGYLELREAATDLCPFPETHRREIDQTGACGCCGWYAGMTLSSQQELVNRKIDRFVAAVS